MNIRAVLIGVAASGALAAPAFAQDYQAEVGISILHLDPDVGRTDRTFGIDGTWHFDPVRTQGLPLAEAAFLGRSSNISAGYAAQDRGSLDFIDLGAEFYVENLYFAANYERTANGSNVHDYGLRAGFLPMDGLRLTVGYDKDDLTDTDIYSVGAKYVAPLIDDSAINIEGELGFADDSNENVRLTVLSDYFFSHEFSAGVRFAYVDRDSGNDSFVGVGSRYFFTPVFSGELEYLSDGDDDIWALRAALRF